MVEELGPKFLGFNGPGAVLSGSFGFPPVKVRCDISGERIAIINFSISKLLTDLRSMSRSNLSKIYFSVLIGSHV